MLVIEVGKNPMIPSVMILNDETGRRFNSGVSLEDATKGMYNGPFSVTESEDGYYSITREDGVSFKTDLTVEDVN